MTQRKGYDSKLQRQRSANSPWRKMATVETNKAFTKYKKVNTNPSSNPRPDLD